MAWGDIRTRRIPNYLTLGTAVAGLGFQAGCHGWAGLWAGFLGLLVGFGLLIIPYILKGMGAGDVKALAALGAWLGPHDTFFLFLYMGVCGGVLILLVLAWRGALGSYLARGWRFIKRRVLNQPFLEETTETSAPQQKVPYGAALALGMAVLYLQGFIS